MDWFLFGSFKVGEAPINVKVGQTTVYWGESLLLGGAIHGISYSQNPIDVMKGLSTPGAEAKELFRPRVGFNINSQVTEHLNVALQYFFNWQDFSNQAYRYPESGSYLTLQDFALWGADSAITGPNPLLAAPAATRAQLCSLVGLANALGTAIGSTSDCFSQNYTRLWRTKDITPDENSGNFGLALRWSPEWVNGTLGFYYRRTYDMQPQGMATPDVIPGIPVAAASVLCQGPTSVLQGLFLQTSATSGSCAQNTVLGYGGLPGFPSPPIPAGAPVFNQTAVDLINSGRVGTYNLAFGDDIDIFGISLSKPLGNLSLGAELSYRTDMPLLSDLVTVLPAALRPAGVPLPAGAIWSDKLPKNDSPGAKGDTLHALVNLLGIMGGSIWDTASWSAELTYMTYLDVTQNEAVFKGRKEHIVLNSAGTAVDTTRSWLGYTLLDKADKNFFGLGINFTPTWFQVKPGMDVLAPLSWSQGISGNSAVLAGGQEGAGSFGLGIALDFYQKYRFDLKYIGFYGEYQSCRQAARETPAVGICVGASPSTAAVFNGTNAVLGDRDYIAFTFKTTF
jgi:hypothetical protein